jgi:TetR/AcrR family transcriptional regulator, transcriptional repressor for nem operon
MDGQAWLSSLIKSYLSRSHRDMMSDGCPLPTLTPDVARGNSEARDNFERHFLIYLSEIEARLEEGSSPPRDRAIALIAQLVGGLMLARALNSETLSNQVLKACRQTALHICEVSTDPPKKEK